MEKSFITLGPNSSLPGLQFLDVEDLPFLLHIT